MKHIFLLCLLTLFAAGCTNKKSFTVHGVIKVKSEKYIYLNRIDVNTPILIDSAKVTGKGRFHFTVNAFGPEFYQLGFSKTNFITLLAEPKEKIRLSFPGKNLYENYSVSGSSGSEKLKSLDSTLAKTKIKLDSLSALYDAASKGPGFDKRGPELDSQYFELVKAQRKKNIEFIINNINSLAAIKALYQTITPDTYVLYKPTDLQYLKIVADSLTRHYPNSRDVQALAHDLSNELNKMYAERLGKMTSELPEAKLDPELKDINGKRIALSSLKGKYVLLAFWSYKSRECVAENMQLKEFYRLYHARGFEIYQINVDENEADWEKAVRFDELPWISTREDDPKNPVNVRLFNVNSLPSNYLFDRSGTIIGTNLHDRILKIRLEQLFSK